MPQRDVRDSVTAGGSTPARSAWRSFAFWRNGVVRDGALNVILGIAKAIAVLVMIRVAGIYLSATALGVFLLARRFSFTIANLAQLGMSQTLLRHVPMSTEDAEKQRWTQYAAVVWIAAAVISLPILFALRGQLSRFFFGAADVDPAVTFWTTAIIFAAVLHYYAISALFARHRIVASNVVELVSNALPLIILLLVLKTSTSVLQLLRTQALSLFALAAISMIAMIARSGWLLRATDLPRMTQILTTYGFSRAVIPFLEMLVLSLGPWLIRASTVDAAHLVVALSLLQMIQIVATPLAQVSSIVGARLTALQEDDRIAAGVRALLGCAMYAAVLIAALVAPWCDVLTKFWLREPALAAGVSRTFIAIIGAIVPLAAYFAAKGVIEVRWTQPYNLWSLAIGAAAQAIAYVSLVRFYGPVQSVRAAVLISLWVVGILTMVWIRNYLPGAGFWGAGRLVAISLALSALNVWLARAVGPAALLPAVAGSLALAAFVLVRVWPSHFVTFLMSMLRPAGERG